MTRQVRWEIPYLAAGPSPLATASGCWGEEIRFPMKATLLAPSIRYVSRIWRNPISLYILSVCMWDFFGMFQLDLLSFKYLKASPLSPRLIPLANSLVGCKSLKTMDPMAGGGRAWSSGIIYIISTAATTRWCRWGKFPENKIRKNEVYPLSYRPNEWVLFCNNSLSLSSEIIRELTSSSLSLSQLLLSHCLLLGAQAMQTMRAEKASNKPLGKAWFSPQKLFQAPTLLLHLNICKSFTAAPDNNLITVPLKFYATTAR